MRHILLIAADEWRYFLRSHLALFGAMTFLLLFAATSVVTTLHINAEHHERAHHQSKSEETFLAQPDRHPHRMVHYGHYVFRAPAPFAVFDPGLDTVTGQSIFLEGHRHNTVMFPESSASADIGGLSWLTPALIYQLFAPLVIILLGYRAVVRERESGTLMLLMTSGITSRSLIMGKALALLSFALLLLIPLVINSLMAIANGECIFGVMSLFGAYGVYLALWSLLTMIASTLITKPAVILAVMAGLWFIICLVLPSVAVNVAMSVKPVPGKIETDLRMLSDLSKLGDGHNANDPAFQKLRADLLQEYNVERIEDLPVNYRGIVASEAEKKLTDVLNRYAESRMLAEQHQEQYLTRYGWLSPMLSMTLASRSIAGTDLAHYHRFQREAESVRYAFVQGLNQAHIEKLSYDDDINRNKDEASWQRARVAASNWDVLETFEFKTALLGERIAKASSSLSILLVWLFAACGLLVWSSRQIKP